MNLPLLITLIIAIYGAILSTITIILKLIERRPHIKVRIKGGYTMSGARAETDTMVMVEAINIGNKSIILNTTGFYANKHPFFCPITIPRIQFPYELQEGKNCIVLYEEKRLAKKLKQSNLSGTIKIWGYFTDVIGNIYKSKPLKFNTESPHNIEL